MARLPIIDLAQLGQLAALQCTQAEIAAFFKVSCQAVEKALRKPAFREVYEGGQKNGLISLKRVQFQKALAGNVTMLIWLGKNYLGQTDKMQHGVTEDLTKRLIGVNVEDI